MKETRKVNGQTDGQPDNIIMQWTYNKKKKKIAVIVIGTLRVKKGTLEVHSLIYEAMVSDYDLLFYVPFNIKSYRDNEG